MELPENRSEIAFFDLETTIPTRSGQGFAILEFGAILVCPRKLVELESYSPLVRPADLSLLSPNLSSAMALPRTRSLLLHPLPRSPTRSLGYSTGGFGQVTTY
ncbi:hypothetical protein Dimus_004931 [Dionaea muscipula]